MGNTCFRAMSSASGYMRATCFEEFGPIFFDMPHNPRGRGYGPSFMLFGFEISEDWKSYGSVDLLDLWICGSAGSVNLLDLLVHVNLVTLVI